MPTRVSLAVHNIGSYAAIWEDKCFLLAYVILPVTFSSRGKERGEISASSSVPCSAAAREATYVVLQRLFSLSTALRISIAGVAAPCLAEMSGVDEFVGERVKAVRHYNKDPFS